MARCSLAVGTEVHLNVDAGRQRVDLLGVAREVGGDVASCDLAGRPPQRVLRHLPVVTTPAGHLCAQVARNPTREQEPAQHGTKRARVHVCAQPRGDRLGCGIRLLGGHAALLQRARGCVTRGVHVLEALDTAMQIHGHEAVAVLREPPDIRPDDARKAHHLVGGKRCPGSREQLALARLHRNAVGQQLDPALLEQLSHRGGGRRPEQLERLRLVRDQLEPGLVQAPLGHVRGREQGELV